MRCSPPRTFRVFLRFSEALGSCATKEGKTVFRVESGPLAEVLSRIEERANYGDTASGTVPVRRAREGTVRLGLRSCSPARPLAAAGRERSKLPAKVRRSTPRQELKRATRFRTTTFSARPRSARKKASNLRACEGCRKPSGTRLEAKSANLNAGAIVSELRKEIARHEDAIASAHGQLIAYRLPGATVLEGAIGQMKAILRGSEDNAIATFNASHRSIKDAIKRAVELEQALSEPRLRDLDRAREALRAAWPFLRKESDVPRGSPIQSDIAPRSFGTRDFLSGTADD